LIPATEDSQISKKHIKAIVIVFLVKIIIAIDQLRISNFKNLLLVQQVYLLCPEAVMIAVLK